MDERRKLERFDLRAPARIVVEDEGGRMDEFNLTTKDVSSDGAYLYTSQPLPEGATVRMEFLIALDTLRKLTSEKGKARVRVKGKVIRVDENGAAIRFESKYKITGVDIGHYVSSSF
jgi:hypothetical protein